MRELLRKRINKNYVRNTKSQNNNDIAILSVLSTEHERRHSTFWELVYKSVFAITTILSLLWFLYEKIQDRVLLSLFSFFATLICIFAGLLLKMESQRMKIINKKRDDIIYRNSQEPKKVNDEFCKKMKDKNWLNRFVLKHSIASMIWVVFVILCYMEY